MTSLADVARELGHRRRWSLLGRGEEQSGGRDKASILADAMEAILRRGLPRPRARRGRASSSSGCSGRGWTPTSAARATATTRPCCRSCASQELGRSPTTACRTRARPPEGVHRHRVPRRASRRGGAPGGRRRKPSSRPRGRRTSDLRSSGAGEHRGGARVELPEVEVMRRDLEKDVVGKRIKEVEVRGPRTPCASIRRPQDRRKEFTARSRATRSRRSNGAGSTS